MLKKDERPEDRQLTSVDESPCLMPDVSGDA